MKKVLFSILIMLALVWNCEMVFARNGGKGKGAARESKRTKRVQRKTSGRGKGKAVEEKAGKGKGKGAARESKQPERVQKRTRKRGKTKAVEEDADKGKGKAKAKAVEEDAGKGKGKAKAKAVEEGAGKGKIKALGKQAGKGKAHQQQMKALERQVIHEGAKHLKRVSRLERIRELAAAEGNTKTVERVEKLLEREKQRYIKKSLRMQEAKQKILQLGEKSLSEEAKKPVEKGAGKGKGKKEAEQ